MPLTEHELAVLEDKPVYATVHNVMALIAELRASQAEARRLRERLGSLAVAWHDTVHMSEISPDIDFACCPKWSCREARAALAAEPATTAENELA